MFFAIKYMVTVRSLLRCVSLCALGITELSLSSVPVFPQLSVYSGYRVNWHTQKIPLSSYYNRRSLLSFSDWPALGSQHDSSPTRWRFPSPQTQTFFPYLGMILDLQGLGIMSLNAFCIGLEYKVNLWSCWFFSLSFHRSCKEKEEGKVRALRLQPSPHLLLLSRTPLESLIFIHARLHWCFPQGAAWNQPVWGRGKMGRGCWHMQSRLSRLQISGTPAWTEFSFYLLSGAGQLIFSGLPVIS